MEKTQCLRQYYCNQIKQRLAWVDNLQAIYISYQLTNSYLKTLFSTDLFRNLTLYWVILDPNLAQCLQYCLSYILIFQKIKYYVRLCSPNNLIFSLFLLFCHLRLSQRVDDTVVG